MEPPSGFEHGTPGSGIHVISHGNHLKSVRLYLIKQKMQKKKLGFFDEHFSTGKNELIGEDNIEYNSNTTEPGSGEINVDECDDEQSFSRDIGTITEPSEALPIPMLFAHITREADVSTFPGMFKAIFEMLKPKAQVMTYWDGQKKTLRLHKRANSAQLSQTLLSSPNYNLDPLLLPISNDGPARKLSLEQELLLTLMKITLNLLYNDLAFQFQISNRKVSQIFIIWIKLVSKEFSVLVIWPSRHQIRATLPECFKKLFQKTRKIIIA